MSDSNDVISELIQEIRREAAYLRAQNAELVSRNAILREQNVRLVTQNAALERSNHQLQEQAFTDQMTEISNYRAFRAQMERAFSLARRHSMALSLILMDLDRFKQFNDTYGHPAGDSRLRQTAQLLQQHVRQSDFFARYGGEEFVFILPATDAVGALRQAERLRQTVAQHTEQGTVTALNVPLTGSFGVSTLRADTPDIEALIDEADVALYACKQFGRNNAIHFDALAPEQRVRPDRTGPAPPDASMADLP